MVSVFFRVMNLMIAGEGGPRRGKEAALCDISAAPISSPTVFDLKQSEELTVPHRTIDKPKPNEKTLVMHSVLYAVIVQTFSVADGLIVRPVADYKAIKSSLSQGDRHRTIAATKMNETSSRAHTIVTLNLHQRRLNNMTTFAAINLVDLAGR